MKRFDELTDQELLAMTDPEVKALMLFECAHQGVKVLPEPVKPVEVKPKMADMYFELEGTHLKSRTAEPLEAILAAIASVSHLLVTATYDWRIGHFEYVEGPNNAHFKVTKNHCYLRSDLDALSDQIRAYKEAKEEFDKDHKAWELNRKSVDSIEEDVHQRLGQLRQREYSLERAKARFGEYVQIAENDMVLARKFYEKAFGPMDQELVERCGFFSAVALPEEEKS